MSIVPDLKDIVSSTSGARVSERTFQVPCEPFEDVLPDRYPHLFTTLDLMDSFLSEPQRRELDGLVGDLSHDPHLRGIIARELDRSSLSAAGYLILDFSDVVSSQLTIRDYIILTATCSIFGQPFGAFRRHGLWKPIDVNPVIDPWRAGGAGFNPLHIDFVNATLPPDYTCFYCVREDPLGEGDSIVSNHLRVFSMLSPDQRALALRPAVYEGKFFDLVGIGSEMRPFPLFEVGTNGSLTCRFTAKSLYVKGDTETEIVTLIKEISELLDRYALTFRLRQKQLLIVDQGIACHGRMPLGDGQAEIPAEQRRLLMQIFMKKMNLDAAVPKD